MIKRYQAILAVIGLIVAMGVAGGMEREDEQRQAAQYCEMVKLWQQTNGQAGWPAYDGEWTCPKGEDND